MYEYSEIKVVHLEITDKCNASCPMCSRNKQGGQINQHLPITELLIDDIVQIFPVEFIQQLDQMYMCGNNGDPIVAQDTLDVFKYFRKHNTTMTLGLHTNGSAKKQEWWEKLAGTLGKYGYVTFGIDGLEDTNYLYRKGTDYNKIIKNAKAFIKAGGRARWDYIVFEHNEHQIETAKSLADEYGFEKFTIKKSGRFFSNTQMVVKGSRDVLDKNGNVEYTISPPKNKEYQNKSLQKEARLIEEYGTLTNYLDSTPINCIIKNEKSIYVSADGNIFPCCWTASQLYVWWKKLQFGEIWNIINRIGGINKINAKIHTLKKITEGLFFKEIEKSWSCSALIDGKLTICSRICGKDFNQFKDQYK